MFGLLKKNPLKKLEKEYAQMMANATDAQRNGNIELFAKLSTEADKLLKEIERLEKEA